MKHPLPKVLVFPPPSQKNKTKTSEMKENYMPPFSILTTLMEFALTHSRKEKGCMGEEGILKLSGDFWGLYTGRKIGS